MIFSVHCDANLRKQLKVLRQAGKKTALVSEHAEAIMERLAREGNPDLKKSGRLTRYGEARIRNCVKFDLVDGYRLLGIKEDHELVFLYVGAHDDCERWVKNNSGLQSAPRRKGTEELAVREDSDESLSCDEEDDVDEPEFDRYEHLLDALDDNELRKIFCGLSGRQL